jgi:GNAT superfamily N-acetyltransferase
MSILPYSPDLAPAMARAYNDLVRGVPHCFPAPAEALATALAPTVEEHAVEADDTPLRDERAFVALDGEGVLGFVHAGLGRRNLHGASSAASAETAEAAEAGILRFLGYRAGERAAGQALLERAEDYLRDRGATEIWAYPQHHRYPFYHLSAAYLSDKLGHVAALLGINGYHQTRGEVYFDWPSLPAFEPHPAPLEAEIRLDWKPAPEDENVRRPSLIVTAHRGETFLGECLCTSCAHYNAIGDAQDWAFTYWLGVEQEVQGQGLGRYLLQRALQELRGAGYRHAAISTARDNYRAALFYSNLGYTVVDWTYEYRKKL